MVRSIVLLIVGVVWCGIAAFLTYLTGRDVLRQVATAEYTPVQAVVADSQVTSRRGSKGKTYYEWSVLYGYEVHGTKYYSRRQSYTGGISSQDLSKARSHASAFPPGATIEAYYNKNDPPDAVLRRGGETSDFLPPAFAMGFLFGGFAMAGWAVNSLMQRARTLVAAGLPVIDDGDRVGVSLSTFNPGLIGAIAGGVAVVGGTILNGLLTGNSVLLVLVGEGLVMFAGLGIALAVGAWAASRRMSPDIVMVFDRRAHTLTLPKNEGRKDSAVFACEIVEDFRMDTYQTKTGKGGTVTHYRINVDVIDEAGNTARHKVRTFGSEGAADSFAAWCRERLLESSAD